MRGLALKIFLSFWLIFVVMIASFAVVPPPEPSPRFVDRVQQNGLVAAALLEQHSAEACDDYLAAVEVQTHLGMTLFDTARAPVCRSPGADPMHLRAEAGGDSETGDILDEGTIARVDITGPAGRPYTAVGVSQRGFDAARTRAPFPYNLVAIAILVSGIVCFAMARYLARPLRLVRDASYRLAAGDLNARAGPSVGARRDEIGDLVRDFDAMAGRLEALLHSQSRLLSDMSHELRSPLARLNVALALARRKSGPEAERDLDRVETEADRMNELIGHVLALARAESHETPAPTQLVDLADVVRGVTDDARCGPVADGDGLGHRIHETDRQPRVCRRRQQQCGQPRYRLLRWEHRRQLGARCVRRHSQRSGCRDRGCGRDGSRPVRHARVARRGGGGHLRRAAHVAGAPRHRPPERGEPG